MLLGEPPRTAWDFRFPLMGIPVRIHPFFWLVAAIIGVRSSDELPGVLVCVAAVLLSILVHELGHATVMRAYGFSPWITLHGFGGLASYRPAETYGSKGTDTVGQILISAAGPAAGFLLAGLVVAGIVLSGHVIEFTLGGSLGVRIAMEQIGSDALTSLLYYILNISIFWGIINLLPVYPLDGGQIAREIFLRVNPHQGIRYSLVLSVFTGAALALIGLLEWHDFFVAFFFGYMAYMSYAMLQAQQGRGPW